MKPSAHLPHTHTQRGREKECDVHEYMYKRGPHRAKVSSRENQQETKLSLSRLYSEWVRLISYNLSICMRLKPYSGHTKFQYVSKECTWKRCEKDFNEKLRNYLMLCIQKEGEEKSEPKNTWIFIFSLMTDRFVKWENTQYFSFGPQFKPMSISDWIQRSTEPLNLGYHCKTWIYVRVANLTSIRNDASFFKSGWIRLVSFMLRSH